MKADVFDLKGNSVEQITLDKGLFEVEYNQDLLAQYLRVFASNQRQGTASTKTRGEVQGSGRKPWKQKGTGRARAGSIRGPIWRHGGRAHGAHPRDWSLDMPKKMKQKVMAVTLSYKLKNDKLKIVKDFNFDKPKTKDLVTALENLNLLKNSIIVLGEKNVNLEKSSSNLKNVNLALVDNLNPYELIKADSVLLTKDAVTKLQKKYENK